ncbi:Carbonic anhydrase 3 [Bulinus truncatus]|nr:Carbonic anhydrase 3 [Bulinus truncatus]
MASSIIPLGKVAIVFTLFSFGISTVNGDAQSWNYNLSSLGGPNNWYKYYPDCGGVMQSPIDIKTNNIIYSPELSYFNFSDYSLTDGVSVRLENIGGHTAEVVYAGTPIILRGGGLPAEYQLAQFHFHWGAEDSRGSEHYIDGKHFPMELHIVHYQKRLANSSVAGQHPFGLAVLGFFFQIQLAGNETEIDAFALLSLLPKDSKQLDFYRYFGSLTTPPCSESVIWSLASEPLKISEYQLNKFRNLYNEDLKKLVDDFRPVQEQNSRIVTTTLKKRPVYPPKGRRSKPVKRKPNQWRHKAKKHRQVYFPPPTDDDDDDNCEEEEEEETNEYE